MPVSGHLGGTLTFTAPGDSYLLRSKVKYIRWVDDQGLSVAGNKLLVVDEKGDVIMRSVSDGKYFIDLLPTYKWEEQINVITMDSGTLDVITE